MELSVGATELQLIYAHSMVVTLLQLAKIALKRRLVVSTTFDLRDLEAVVFLIIDWDVQLERWCGYIVTEALQILPRLIEGLTCNSGSDNTTRLEYVSH